jgi:hypothetical protein
MQRGDVRVIELREEASLAFETNETFLVLQELLGKDFDSNVSSAFGVAGSIDFSHSTRTDRLDDFVLAELGSRGEGHG